ncbi:desmoglein-2.1-like [Pseudorasbora parva]|uniref:desmoglein-2.1-like n=1 Tax=Pseudorasbora parva TaxID=51549 RepID=UPI00351E116A
MLPHALAPTLLLLVTLQILSTGDCWKGSQKLRHKREWVVPFKKIIENVDYSSEPYISKMRSDMDRDVPLRYTLRGPGANQPPFGCFIVDEYKGFIRITPPLDREERENYTLIGTAWFFNNTIAEDNIIVNIRVEDQNDNSPVFIKPKRSSVYERSPVGTFVTQVVAKDADKPHTPHSKIAYSIIKQEPNNGVLFFDVNKSSGEISVSNPTLDREEHSSYVLTVQAADMNGDAQGNSATATVSIVILDVNDNIPTLEKDEFEASIEENTAQVEVIRLKVTDLDLKDTDNWAAKCFIASGNEAGFFSIKMDPKTNEAILMLVKAVDYEDVKDLKLGIGVVNNAPFHPSVIGGQSGMNVNFGGSGGGGGGGGGGGVSSSSGGGSSSSSLSSSGGQIYNVNVKVKNQPEGPKFMPLIKAIPISEGKTFNSNEIITRYPAIDEDTGEEATNVKYFKASDPDNWLRINETTGAVRLNKAPDRESKFLVNGTYYAAIYSITQDWPSKTATGTIAIQVEDFNDHCPTLLSKVLRHCTDKDAVLVTAVDEDAPPNGAPFTFNVVPEGTKGKWSIEHLNDTTAIFRTQEKMWPGEHELTVDVKDQQGLGCPEPQKIVVEVCTCTDRGACARTVAGTLKKGSTFGPAGICLLFLGLLPLLLIPLLLLLCQCGAAGMAGAFRDMPYDTKEHLISYHTEGQGEDRDVPVPTDFTDGGGRPMSLKSKDVGGMRINGVGGGGGGGGFMESNSIIGFRGYNDMEMAYMDSLRRDETLMSREMAGDFDGMAVSEMFLDEYYSQKSRGLKDGFAKNEPMVYGYEGKGSPVGSVGCCSMLEDNNDLEFLNDLGPKFNTLAEICFREGLLDLRA